MFKESCRDYTQYGTGLMSPTGARIEFFSSKIKNKGDGGRVELSYKETSLRLKHQVVSYVSIDSFTIPAKEQIIK